VLEREFRSVPASCDVVSWGGGIKQYQITIDPARLRAYNLTLKQVFDAVSANNANAAAATSRRTVRARRCAASASSERSTISRTSWSRRRRDAGRGPRLGLAGIGHAIRFGVLGRDHEDDLVQGIVLMRKGENPGAVLDGIEKKLGEIRALLPAGVAMTPYYSRDRLVKTTVTTVMRNLVEGALLVTILLSLLLYNVRAALIVAVVIPLSLLFAFVFMDLRGHSREPLVLGAIDFGIIVDGAVIMTENIVRHLAERRASGPRSSRRSSTPRSRWRGR
jgi:cobalt-zinc-cadmium resistance protein CzcA